MKSPISRPARARLRLAHLRRLAGYEKALRPKLAELIARQGAILAGHYREHGSVGLSAIHGTRQELAELLTSFYLSVGRAFAGTVVRSLKSSTFERLLRAWVESRALEAVDDIDEHTLDLVRGVISRGSRTGVDVGAIATLIEDATSATNSAARARAIARTEMHDAAGFAQLEAARSTGLELVKTWTANLDDRTRDAHSAADGQTVPLDEPFVVGGEQVMRPGEGSAANAVNCRCTVVFAEVPTTAS